MDLVSRHLLISWRQKVIEILLNNQNSVQIKAIHAPCCSIPAYVEPGGKKALCFA